MMPINRPVRVVTKDGTIVNGRRLNEDTYSLQIIDDGERLHSLLKSDLREFTISTTSPMPSYKGTLSGDEMADVVAYLLSLKGQLLMSANTRLLRRSWLAALASLLFAPLPRARSRSRRSAWRRRANEPQNWLTYSGGYSASDTARSTRSRRRT